MKIKVIKIILASLLLFAANQARAAEYNFYVDANSSQEVQDGTQNYPWKTITQATDYIREHGLKKERVYISRGTYNESITLRNHTRLYGENKENTIIDAGGKSAGIYFESTKSTIKDITVRNANNNLIVDRKSKVTVENCEMKDSAIVGIEIKKGSNRKSYVFTMTNSSVNGGKKYGIYASARRISLKGNYIHKNGEEGVDLHDGIKGTIRNNRIEDNGESGIELILAGTNLTIQSNDIKNNDAQGIGVQVYSSKKGKVNIKKNTITGNGKYGIKFIRFASSLRDKFVTFIKKNVKLSKNTIRNNDDGDYNYDLN
ncbi:MAG: right-handed parallel beta-helix repeat-containing protein [Parcubacteria group bacterium]